MITSKITSAHHRTFRSFSGLFFIGSAIVAGGCSHAWEDYDPRGSQTEASASSSSSGGPGGSSGTGVSVSSSGTGMGGMGMGGMGMGGAGSGGAGSGGGGAGGGGGGPVEKCGGTSVVVSEFANNDIDILAEIGSWGDGVISEINGELVAKMPMMSPNGAGAYVITDYYYDFREDFVSVELTKAPNASNQSWAAMSVGPNDDNYVEIYVKAGDLVFGMEISGNYSNLLIVPYDPMAHRFWQIRETMGRVYYETSPDGQNWTTQTDVATPQAISFQYSRMALSAGTDPMQADPGEPHFDNFNGGGMPKQGYCPISSMKDDFDDGIRGDEWLRSWEGQPSMLAEEGGQFVIHYSPNVEGYAGFVSSRAFNLTSDALIIEIPQVPPTSLPAHVGVELVGPGNNEIEMFMEEGKLKFGIELLGVFQELGAIVYSPVNHRWWRIREEANTLYWETAPDGKTWTARFDMTPAPFPVNIFGIELFGGVWSAQPMPGVCSFDNLNLPPP